MQSYMGITLLVFCFMISTALICSMKQNLKRFDAENLRRGG